MCGLTLTFLKKLMQNVDIINNDGIYIMNDFKSKSETLPVLCGHKLPGLKKTVCICQLHDKSSFILYTNYLT